MYKAMVAETSILTILIIALLKVIIEYKILDPLLFLSFCLLLCLHSNCKRRVRGKFNCASLVDMSGFVVYTATASRN